VAFKSINPHNPSEVIGEFEEAGPYDVEIAVVRAGEAFFEWREQPASVRSSALADMAEDVEKWAEELVRLTVIEVGKPIGEACAEVEQAVAILRYFAQMVLAPDSETYPARRYKDWLITHSYPLGVCVIITPWNLPVAIPAWKVASALGYGNTVVLKPAPFRNNRPLEGSYPYVWLDATYLSCFGSCTLLSTTFPKSHLAVADRGYANFPKPSLRTRLERAGSASIDRLAWASSGGYRCVAHRPSAPGS
jgi:Aldehyde dehydrogenase family